MVLTSPRTHGGNVIKPFSLSLTFIIDLKVVFKFSKIITICFISFFADLELFWLLFHNYFHHWSVLESDFLRLHPSPWGLLPVRLQLAWPPCRCRLPHLLHIQVRNKKQTPLFSSINLSLLMQPSQRKCDQALVPYPHFNFPPRLFSCFLLFSA